MLERQTNPASSSQRVKREGESELKVSFSLRSDDRVTVSDGPWRGGRVAVRRVWQGAGGGKHCWGLGGCGVASGGDKDTTSVSWAGDPRSSSLWYWQHSLCAWAAAKRQRWLHYSDSCGAARWGRRFRCRLGDTRGLVGFAFNSVSQKRCKRQHFHSEAKLMLISWAARELILSAHKFITTREPGEQSVFFIYLLSNRQQLLPLGKERSGHMVGSIGEGVPKVFNEQSFREKTHRPA